MCNTWERRDDMKTALFIISLITILATAGNVSAAKHNYPITGDRLQPDQISGTISGSDDPATKENIEIILQKLNDPDPFVRVEAVQALGEIQKEKSLATLCDCLADDNLYVRAYAAEALGKIGQVDIERTLSQLLPALDDPSPYVRAMMVIALGELQDERAVDSVRKLLHDEDDSVREMAAWALAKIEKSQ
jgi:HEAT repeat protein